MRRHPVRLEQAGIDPARYEELKAICKQYSKYKRQVAAIRRGDAEGRRKVSGAWHRPDPTGQRAVMLVDNYAQRRIDAIEGAAKAADRSIWKDILINVTTNRDYDHIIPTPPCGRAQFYRGRLLFFVELDARI